LVLEHPLKLLSRALLLLVHFILPLGLESECLSSFSQSRRGHRGPRQTKGEYLAAQLRNNSLSL
jgi:hypothetical protein